MELSEEALLGLQIAADADKIPFNRFEPLVQHVFKGILDEKERNSALEDETLSVINGKDLRLAYFGLVAVVIEARKQDVGGSMLSSYLEDCKLQSDRVKIIVQHYNELESPLESHLSQISFHLPHIINADWRLDYCIKSNHVDKMNQVLYFISLTTEKEDSQKENIQFYCTIEQLQDLMGKLKDAVKCLEIHSQA